MPETKRREQIYSIAMLAGILPIIDTLVQELPEDVKLTVDINTIFDVIDSWGLQQRAESQSEESKQQVRKRTEDIGRLANNVLDILIRKSTTDSQPVSVEHILTTDGKGKKPAAVELGQMPVETVGHALRAGRDLLRTIEMLPGEYPESYYVLKDVAAKILSATIAIGEGREVESVASPEASPSQVLEPIQQSGQDGLSEAHTAVAASSVSSEPSSVVSKEKISRASITPGTNGISGIIDFITNTLSKFKEKNLYAPITDNDFELINGCLKEYTNKDLQQYIASMLRKTKKIPSAAIGRIAGWVFNHIKSVLASGEFRLADIINIEKLRSSIIGPINRYTNVWPLRCDMNKIIPPTDKLVEMIAAPLSIYWNHLRLINALIPSQLAENQKQLEAVAIAVFRSEVNQVVANVLGDLNTKWTISRGVAPVASKDMLIVLNAWDVFLREIQKRIGSSDTYKVRDFCLRFTGSSSTLLVDREFKNKGFTFKELLRELLEIMDIRSDDGGRDAFSQTLFSTRSCQVMLDSIHMARDAILRREGEEKIKEVWKNIEDMQIQEGIDGTIRHKRVERPTLCGIPYCQEELGAIAAELADAKNKINQANELVKKEISENDIRVKCFQRNKEIWTDIQETFNRLVEQEALEILCTEEENNLAQQLTWKVFMEYIVAKVCKALLCWTSLFKIQEPTFIRQYEEQYTGIKGNQQKCRGRKADLIRECTMLSTELRTKIKKARGENISDEQIKYIISTQIISSQQIQNNIDRNDCGMKVQEDSAREIPSFADGQRAALKQRIDVIQQDLTRAITQLDWLQTIMSQGGMGAIQEIQQQVAAIREELEQLQQLNPENGTGNFVRNVGVIINSLEEKAARFCESNQTKIDEGIRDIRPESSPIDREEGQKDVLSPKTQIILAMSKISLDIRKMDELLESCTQALKELEEAEDYFSGRIEAILRSTNEKKAELVGKRLEAESLIVCSSIDGEEMDQKARNLYEEIKELLHINYSVLEEQGKCEVLQLIRDGKEYRRLKEIRTREKAWLKTINPDNQEIDVSLLEIQHYHILNEYGISLRRFSDTKQDQEIYEELSMWQTENELDMRFINNIKEIYQAINEENCYEAIKKLRAVNEKIVAWIQEPNGEYKEQYQQYQIKVQEQLKRREKELFERAASENPQLLLSEEEVSYLTEKILGSSLFRQMTPPGDICQDDLDNYVKKAAARYIVTRRANVVPGYRNEGEALILDCQYDRTYIRGRNPLDFLGFYIAKAFIVLQQAGILDEWGELKSTAARTCLKVEVQQWEGWGNIILRFKSPGQYNGRRIVQSIQWFDQQLQKLWSAEVRGGARALQARPEQPSRLDGLMAVGKAVSLVSMEGQQGPGIVVAPQPPVVANGLTT